ncbi:MAG: hypothetical protein M1816_001192 [Peltula sp. TS41687]|nr:MAG: hypothetical protein M1816_001192 [Peltula sp. TS41687]
MAATAAATLLLRNHSRSSSYICARCRRLSTSTVLTSGHSRWSKIKHDKGKSDAQKNKQRSVLAKELMQASKMFGPDPNANPRLAAAVAAAKQAGFPKASVDSAIARGQGVSSTGSALQPVVVEAMLPALIAVVIDCQTSSKARTLQDLRTIIKQHEGNVTPTGYMFSKRGRVVFEPRRSDGSLVDAEDVLDEAVEAGAEDVQVDGEENIVVYTEPSKTVAVASALSKTHTLKVARSDIIWDPNLDTLVCIESETTVNHLLAFLEDLQDEPSVQGVYMNVSRGGYIADSLWAELQSKLDI